MSGDSWEIRGRTQHARLRQWAARRGLTVTITHMAAIRGRTSASWTALVFLDGHCVVSRDGDTEPAACRAALLAGTEWDYRRILRERERGLP